VAPADLNSQFFCLSLLSAGIRRCAFPCYLEKEGEELTRHRWLVPVILATWEAEIRIVEVRGHPKQIVPETPFSKITRVK
jgi:hypothetical protein